MHRDFPGSPVAKTMCSHFRGHRLNSWLGNQILHASWYSQKKIKIKKEKEERRKKRRGGDKAKGRREKDGGGEAISWN